MEITDAQQSRAPRQPRQARGANQLRRPTAGKEWQLQGRRANTQCLPAAAIKTTKNFEGYDPAQKYI